MERSDFKIVANFYKTSSLTMIFYQNIIIESVEIYKNYKTFEDEASKKERLESNKKDKAKPIKMKSSKEKRTEAEINGECERLIKNYINVHQL